MIYDTRNIWWVPFINGDIKKDIMETLTFDLDFE